MQPIHKIFLFVVICFCFFTACNLTSIDETEELLIIEDDEFNVSIAKWYNNFPAAISITNDAVIGGPKSEEIVQDLVKKNGLTISYEIVTNTFVTDSLKQSYLLNTYLPKGFGYFGHGHKHINHDAVSERMAYESFKKCYDTMVDFGLKPVSYAYPGGFGYKQRTQKALKDAGFLAGRKYEKLDFDYPYIMPNEESKPENWFQLPTLAMQSYDFNHCSICINNTEELSEYLDSTIAKKAWLILTYHSIGRYDGFGYYRLEDFQNDLFAIKNRDFWVASMDDITLYSYARNASKVSVKTKKDEYGELNKISLKIENNLTNPIFNVPLTLIVNVPKYWKNKIKLDKNPEGFNILKDDNKLIISVKPDEEIVLTHH